MMTAEIENFINKLKMTTYNSDNKYTYFNTIFYNNICNWYESNKHNYELKIL